jgi:hypothetical protein
MLVAQFPDRVLWPLVDWSVALLSALGLLLRGARLDAIDETEWVGHD